MLENVPLLRDPLFGNLILPRRGEDLDGRDGTKQPHLSSSAKSPVENERLAIGNDVAMPASFGLFIFKIAETMQRAKAKDNERGLTIAVLLKKG